MQEIFLPTIKVSSILSLISSLAVSQLWATEVPLKARTLKNPTAYITSQCYTKTRDEETSKAAKPVHNPCFSCHTKPIRPNFLPDGATQLSYAFPGEAQNNPWTNLFKDRTQQVAAITDTAITTYIREENYLNQDGTIALASQLSHVPPQWDYNNNGRWDGYVPDCYYNFDKRGFDHIPQQLHSLQPGNNSIQETAQLSPYTGWRAFGYYPFLGTFWPTNGSTDDVLIRLPKIFQQTPAGSFDLTIYRVNLAIVESLLKRN